MMKNYLQDDICNNPRLFRTWQEKLAAEDEGTIAQAWRLQYHRWPPCVLNHLVVRGVT